jgi:hypothetical protein
MPYGESGVPAGFLINSFIRKAKLITQNSSQCCCEKWVKVGGSNPPPAIFFLNFLSDLNFYKFN